MILKSPVLRKALFSQLPKPKDDFAPKNLVMQRTSLGWSAAAALMAISLFVSAASANAMGLGGPDPWFGGVSAALNAGLASGQKQPTESRALNQEEKRQMQRLRSENQRLWRWMSRREMNLKGLAGGTLARVVGRDPHEWLSGVRLNVGAADGIKRGNLVMAEQGVLGRVIQVDDHSCRVSLCLGPSSVMAGNIPSRKAGGVLKGKGLAALEMSYIDPDAGVKDGDVVVTSGQDGLFPRGLPIGTIRGVHRSNDTSFLFAQVAPFVKLDDVSEVMVLP